MKHAEKDKGHTVPVAPRRWLQGLGLVIVAGLTLASGAIQGQMSRRWGAPPDLQAAAGKLETVPEQFGDWQLQSSDELSDEVAATLECAGYLVRQYANRDPREVVNVAVLVGPPGPISVHTPEVCFSSVDYQLQDRRREIAIETGDRQPDRFWQVAFRKTDRGTESLSVYYGWSTGGPWVAAGDPRFAFAASPVLYKIQLATVLPPGSDPELQDAGHQFLRDFLPIMRRYLHDASKR